MEFVDFAPGEPNGVDANGGEDAVELDFRQRLSRNGEWNDATTSQEYEMVRTPSSNSTATIPLTQLTGLGARSSPYAKPPSLRLCPGTPSPGARTCRRRSASELASTTSTIFSSR